MRKKIKSRRSLLEWNLDYDLSAVFSDIETMSLLVKEEIKSFEATERRFYKKLINWDENLELILSQIRRVRSEIIPTLEHKFSLKFKDVNRVILALFSRTVKNVFLEMEKDSSLKEKYPDMFNVKKIDFFSNLGDLAEGLATYGDQVLGIAAAHVIWEGKGLIPKGEITHDKETLVKNSALYAMFSVLNLGVGQISVKSEDVRTKPKKIHRKTGTYVEALFWVIYSENGLQPVINILKNF